MRRPAHLLQAGRHQRQQLLQGEVLRRLAVQPQPLRCLAAQAQQVLQRCQRCSVLAAWQALQPTLQEGQVQVERRPQQLAGVEEAVPAAADEGERLLRCGGARSPPPLCIPATGSSTMRVRVPGHQLAAWPARLGQGTFRLVLQRLQWPPPRQFSLGRPSCV